MQSGIDIILSNKNHLKLNRVINRYLYRIKNNLLGFTEKEKVIFFTEVVNKYINIKNDKTLHLVLRKLDIQERTTGEGSISIIYGGFDCGFVNLFGKGRSCKDVFEYKFSNLKEFQKELNNKQNFNYSGISIDLLFEYVKII